MMASAAGLNRLADRERKMYLLRTAVTEVIVATYRPKERSIAASLSPSVSGYEWLPAFPSPLQFGLIPLRAPSPVIWPC